MQFEIGICVYNEEKNIYKLLNFLNKEQFSHELRNIFVVCSGCTDNSEEIVKEFFKINNKIVLIREEKRLGIPHALNQILNLMKSEILVYIHAEDLPEKKSIDKLLDYFNNTQVGAVNGHAIPINCFKLNRTVREIYNKIYMPIKSMSRSLDFLTGEFCAFRNVVSSIPLDQLNPDLWIGKKIWELGYKIEYCDDAISTFKGAPNILEYIKQQSRYIKANRQIRRKELVSDFNKEGTFIIKLIFHTSSKFNWIKLIAVFFLQIICILKSKFYKKGIKWEKIR